MKIRLALALLAATCAAASAGEVLTADGLDRVAIGKTRSQLQDSLAEKFPELYQGDCVVMTTPKSERRGITYLMENRRLSRVNVDYYAHEPATIRTAEGIGLGSSEEDVKKVYGSRVRVEPDAGDPTWHYLYVDNADGSRGLRFDTDGAKVKSMHGGAYPALSYKQGCN